MLQPFLAQALPRVDETILRVVEAAGDCSLYNLAMYQLGWMDSDGRRLSAEEAAKHGGKKLRPAIALISCGACGADWDLALPAAAAIELIHNFSLVHDDVEDGDRLRRHRLTVWGVWGVPKAVNCGSAMQALVNRAAIQAQPFIGADRALGILELLTDAILEMTEGQHLDLDFQERGAISVVEYFDMTSRKTGALLEAACRAGARMAAATPDQENALARFGRSFGLAFQARDDYLGVWADPNQTGKAVGADIQRRKKSLPVVYALEHDPRGAGKLIREVMAKPEISTEECARVAEALEACDARRFTENACDRHTADAREILQFGLRPSEYREMLLELANMAALRRH